MPQLRSKRVIRPRLLELLNEGQHRKLTVIAAPAGYGKTTLVSEWLASCARPAAWLSLDEEDRDPARFMMYLVAALQTIERSCGAGMAHLLQSAPLPPVRLLMTTLLHDLLTIASPFFLVLDDYHVIKEGPLDEAISFLLERMPPKMHVIITTREEPRLPIARLRMRDQVTEVRATDLRFTDSEAADFLGSVMGLSLTAENIALLEARTEGWVAGLQLAALSMKEQKDAASLLSAFTGNHRFVLDYFVEEVLKQQPADIQTFLLHTSILDRLCGPLCDALLAPSRTGQETLESLERANLFIVPLDSERRWYRYHHLFAELLQQRLHQSLPAPFGNNELHIRASQWYEDNGLELEAFQHAVAAGDIERAARLVEGGGMPLHFRGAVAPVRNWLEALPKEELDNRPALMVMYASVLLLAGQTTNMEPKLQAAEKALEATLQNEHTRDVIGHIAAIRATIAVSKHQADTILTQARLALEFAHADNLPVRTATVWAMGYAYQLQGNRVAASQAYHEALLISQQIGHFIITMMATYGIGMLQEAENQLPVAAETYKLVLALSNNQPLPVACEAHLGLARIFYEWNDLESANDHAQQTIHVAQLLEDTQGAVAGEMLLARLLLANGDVSSATAKLAKAEYRARQHRLLTLQSHIAEEQVRMLLPKGNLSAAAKLVKKHELAIGRARVHLAKGNSSAALAVLESELKQAETNGLEGARLKIVVLLAVALYVHGEKEKSVQTVLDALTIAWPGGFIRIFVDEGTPMRQLLGEAAKSGIMLEYIHRLQAQFAVAKTKLPFKTDALIEPLSEREREILTLIAEGLSNHDISERLFLALSTVKGHNRNIFDKLQVKRRTEAVARARELGLL